MNSCKALQAEDIESTGIRCKFSDAGSKLSLTAVTRHCTAMADAYRVIPLCKAVLGIICRSQLQFYPGVLPMLYTGSTK